MATEVNAKVMAVVVLGIVSVSHWKKITKGMLFSLTKKKKKSFAAEEYNNDL